MTPEEIGASLLTTFIGISLITGILSEAVKRAWDPSPELQDRWMPILNLGLGIVLGIVGAIFVPDAVTRATLLNGAVVGLFGGAAAGGLYDAVRGFKKTG